MTGEIDVVAVADFGGTAAAQAAGAEVWVDLSGVTFMDSSGLRLLVALHDSARAVHLVDVPALVTRLLDVTGMTGLFGEA